MSIFSLDETMSGSHPRKRSGRKNSEGEKEKREKKKRRKRRKNRGKKDEKKKKKKTKKRTRQNFHLDTHRLVPLLNDLLGVAISS